MSTCFGRETWACERAADLTINKQALQLVLGGEGERCDRADTVAAQRTAEVSVIGINTLRQHCGDGETGDETGRNAGDEVALEIELVQRSERLQLRRRKGGQRVVVQVPGNIVKATPLTAGANRIRSPAMFSKAVRSIAEALLPARLLHAVSLRGQERQHVQVMDGDVASKDGGANGAQRVVGQVKSGERAEALKRLHVQRDKRVVVEEKRGQAGQELKRLCWDVRHGVSAQVAGHA